MGQTLKVLLVSCNTNQSEPVFPHHPQDLPPDVSFNTLLLTDETFPLRTHALSPRLQAKIPKLFPWELTTHPYDLYIWVDASFQLAPTAVAWLLAELGSHEFLVFRHPVRSSVAREARHLSQFGSTPYLHSRYEGEWLHEQMTAYFQDPDFVDKRLFACGCLVFRPTDPVKALMKEWWHQITRYHVNDQLSLPYALTKCPVDLAVLDLNIYKTPHLLCKRGMTP